MDYDLTPPTPQHLGFPHKEWWSGQRQGVEQIVNFWRSGTKVVMMNGPTGAGKSITAMGAAATYSQLQDQSLDVTVLTQTRDLQSQYVDEFPTCEAATGRSNWPCGLASNKRASQCDLIGTAESCPITCPYRRQREVALAAPIRAINYAYYGATEPMFHSSIMVADEADYLGQLLTNAKSVDVTPFELDLPTGIIEDSTRSDLVSEFQDLLAQKPEPELRELAKRTVTLLEGKHYIVKNLDGLLIPWPESKLVKRFARQPTLVMSATLLAPMYWSTEWNLDIGWVELPCPVPAAKRPIRLCNVTKLNKDSTEDDYKLIIQAIDNIIANRLELKGVIHSVSNWLTQMILKYSKYKYLMFHAAGETRMAGIRDFLKADRGVLIGPNLTRGLNLVDDHCRYIIFPKTPYPSLGDVRIQEMMKGGQEDRYSVETLSTIIQGQGRGIRSREDYCETFILDSSVNYLLKKTKNWLPGWVQEAIIEGG